MNTVIAMQIRKKYRVRANNQFRPYHGMKQQIRNLPKCIWKR